jgi:hypothetical protein
LLYGLGNLNPNLRAPIAPVSIGKLRVRLDEISAKYDQIAATLDDPDTPSDYRAFITWARRGTTDTAARVGRAEFLCGKLAEVLR